MRLFLAILVIALPGLTVRAADLPNILWLVLEDTSPHFIGCYGNKSAKTPNIDRLAARGIRFNRAFANAPVCSSARTTIITGIQNYLLGTGNHRSSYPLPDVIKGFPTFLRESGYRTYNNVKTDYSTSSEERLILESWDESSRQAGWWKSSGDQPVFSVFNFDNSHQSRTMTNSYSWYQEHVWNRLPIHKRIADDAFNLPPFLPDTPAIRHEFARIPNSIALADREIGLLLMRLKKDQLYENTIVFCYADHGEAMPRGKSTPIGLGYRVPFIVAFPEKWKHLNPWGAPGTTTNELICFDDLGPTMLSLAGQPPSPSMTGRPFLGKYRIAPRPFVFGARNRIDENAGCARSITDGRFLYTRRFLPGSDLPSMKYFDVATIVRELRKPGTLKGKAANMLDPAPHEVLYDLEADPWELTNLADHEKHSDRVSRMRGLLFDHLTRSGDVLLLPEYQLSLLSEESTPYQYGQAMPEKRRRAILEAADLASRPDGDPKLQELLDSNDPIVSYWAAIGMRLHPELLTVTTEPVFLPARIEIAAARLIKDGSEAAAETLRQFARSTNPDLRLHALQRIQDLGDGAKAFRETLEFCLKQGNLNTRSSAEVTLYRLGLNTLGY